MLDRTRIIPVTWQHTPLYGEVYHDFVIEGTSIAEIVEAIPSKPLGFEEYGFVCINGEPIPREQWKYVRPKVRNKDVVVTLHVRLHSSNTLRIIASVAIIALAVIAGPLGAGLLGFTAGTAAFSLASAGISAGIAIGGSLLLSALAPPPANPNILQSQSTGSDVKPAALTGNVIDPGGSVPRVLGLRKVFPPFVSPPLVELIDKEEIVEGVYGLLGPHSISDIRIGGVPAAQMQEVNIEIVQGFENSSPQSLVTRQSKTQSPAIELSKHLTDPTTQNRLLDQGSPNSDIPYFHRLITRDSPDEFWLSVNWPQGFFRTDNSVVAIPVRVRMRLLGNTAWINMPEVHFYSNQANTLQTTIKLMWTGPISVLPTPPATATAGPTLAYKVVPSQVMTPAGTGWTADSYFSAASGNDLLSSATVGTTNVRNVGLFPDRVEFNLDPNVFPKGIYEVEIIRGCYYLNNQFTAATYADNQMTTPPADFFTYWFDGSFYRINSDQGLIKDQMLVQRVTNVWNEYPVTPGAPFALIAIKARGRSIQEVSCMAGGLVDVGGSFVTSTNPADHYLDVLTSTLGSFPLAIDQVDVTGLASWKSHCTAMGYTINSVIQGMKQPDVLQLIAAAGFARPIQSEVWGVAQDRDRTADSPIQIFTPRNMADFQWTRTFSPFTDGFRVKYDNSLIDYVEDQIVVLDPEAQTGGIRLEDIRYETLVTRGDAVTRALFDLKQARRRLVFYSGVADIENIACRRGDLIGVSHDTLDKDTGFGRISQVLTSGGNITGIVLDDSIPAPTLDFFNIPTLTFFNDPTLAFFNKPTRIGVMIRTTVGTMLVKEVTTTQDDALTLTFVTPFADTGIVLPDCLITSGPLTRETRRLLVQTVQPKDQDTATLTFVDEAPDLWV